MRDVYDVRVYLAPPEELRRKWKVQRDCSRRGYTTDQVLAELDRREPDSEAFIRPQQHHADILVSFLRRRRRPGAPRRRADAALVLPHPDLTPFVERRARRASSSSRARRRAARAHPGHFDREHAEAIEETIWERLHFASHLRARRLGEFTIGTELHRSESLALVQLLILYHLVTAQAAASLGGRAPAADRLNRFGRPLAGVPVTAGRGRVSDAARGLARRDDAGSTACASTRSGCSAWTPYSRPAPGTPASDGDGAGRLRAVQPFPPPRPRAPRWPDRDRFVLSAGHGSMLLYSILHLSGYDLPLAELQRFRQWGSRTPGHPERVLGHGTPGVETTTGPLGQGFANGVGMAMAERFLRERFGSAAMDHGVFGICSDGDLMEGITGEAASLAGHLGLGRIVYLYDDNGITIDGDTSLSFATEDVEARFRAYGWHTTSVEDANDLSALEAAISEAVAEAGRPSLVRVRSVIGYPAPTKQGTSAAHGAPLGEDEVRATKEALGWDPDARFEVPALVRAAFAQVRTRGGLRTASGSRACTAGGGPSRSWRRSGSRAWRGLPEPGLASALPSFDTDNTPSLATRVAGGRALAALAAHVPTMVGGSADLVESTKTLLPTAARSGARPPGATSIGAFASMAWVPPSTGSRCTAGSSSRSGRRSSCSPTTCARRSAWRR